MARKFSAQLKDSFGFFMQWVRTKADVIALVLIAVVITLPSIAPLSSGNKVNLKDDFFYYAGMHEEVRKAVLEYQAR